MRLIKEIIVHCTATPEGKDYGAKDIDRWHRAQGWDGIGYHYVVRLDGTVEKGRADSARGAHCVNHNAQSIGVVYVGGISGKDGTMPKDTRTPAQKAIAAHIAERAAGGLPGGTDLRTPRLCGKGLPLL